MVSTAGIIIIGDEILSGRTKDTNINWIATELNNIGVRLIEARIISDDSETIIETVKTKKTGRDADLRWHLRRDHVRGDVRNARPARRQQIRTTTSAAGALS